MPARQPPRQLTRFSSRRGVGRSDRPQALTTMHESVGMLDAYDLAIFCERRGVSYHAIADNQKIVYTVNRNDTAWHLRNGNPYADGLCLTTPTAGYNRHEWLNAQIRKVEYAAWWTAIVCEDRGIDILACSHQNILQVMRGNKSAGGVIGHVDYTLATRDGTHVDPRNFPTDVMLEMAQAMAGYSDWETRGNSPPPPPPPPSIRGEIKHIYEVTPGLSEKLGPPVTIERTAPDGKGKYNHFESWGSIYWFPSIGAKAVGGAIRAKWSSLGWERSPLGYPTSHEFGFEHPNRNGDMVSYRQSNFQHGYIIWNPEMGAIAYY